MSKFFLLIVLIIVLFAVRPHHLRSRRRCFYRKRSSQAIPSATLSSPNNHRRKKPEWVRRTVLKLHERFNLSHRKLADMFNQLYFASSGHSVGRTWVRELLIREAYAALHRQRELKHQVPPPMPINRIWAIDTTCVTDAGKTQHIVLGIVDHGARLNLALQYLERLNAYTFLSCVFWAMGKFGKPAAIKTDNHPVFRAKWVKRVLRWCGVRLIHSRPARPWENGRIERLFGTFKSCLRGYAIRDVKHLVQSLADFQFWYNTCRSHQHLGGLTPSQAWSGIDPYAITPKTVSEFTAWNGRLKGLVLRH